jgi:drug/metabolite transporter superfamily protein YnfA
MAFLSELWLFLKTRKKLWLLPIVVLLVLFGALLLAQSSAVAPFIYSIF